jgi:hypothetical protein
MRCEECGIAADERAVGWRALIAFDPRDEDWSSPVSVDT